MRKLSTDLIKSGSFTGSFSGSFYGLSPSSSYALTASYSINSISASYSLNSTTATNLSGGTVNAISITGSLLGTSSLANNAISSSFSSVSISSSYALTASNLSPIAQDLIPITGSTYSLGSPTNKWKDLYVSTGSIYIGETVLSTSGSTLFANSSPVVTLNTASGQIEVAGITASLSSSFASNANLLNNIASTVFATTGSNNFSGSQIVQGNITVIGSLIAQQYVVSSSVSYFTSSNFDGSTKFGDTDSDTHQFTGSLRSPNITGSLLGTASIALVALTSSYINVATNAVSSSFASTASVSVSSSYSSYAITASYVLNSVSSSYSLNSVSSSYSNVANTATSATSANTATSSSFATTAGTATSATSANSATSASYALTASFALNSSGGGGGSGTVSGSVNYISKFTSGSAIGNSVIYETGSNIGIGTINPNAKLNINSSGSLVSGSVVFSVEGTQGSLFSVDDSLSGSLMSVNDISGLPILEVFSDDRLVVGTYNSNALVVTGSRVGIGTNNPIAKLQVSGNISGSSFTSSVSNGVGFLGTSSFAVTASYALNALTASFALNASGGGGGSGTVTGSLNYISKFTSTTTVGNSVMYETGSNIGIGTINPNAKLNINSSGSLVSGSVVFSVEGTQGSLFSVDDSLSGSLMSVNDISGLPILEVFSDDRLVVGTYNSNALVVTGSRVGIGTNNPIAKLQVNGNISASSFTGSVFGTSSWATNALTASYAAGGGTTLTTGSTYPITSSWSTNAISSSFATFAVSATSATSATSANTATSASYATVAGSATSATSATSANSANTATSASYSLSASYSVNSTTATSSSFASTSSYNLNSISSSFSVNALTASYNLNNISSSYALTASYALVAGSGGSGGSTSTSSLIGQTFVPTASVSQLSLTQSVSNNDQILVILDGLVQSRTGSYTVTGSTLNLTENADSGSIIDVRFLAGSSVSSSYATIALSASYLISTTTGTTKAIFGYGYVSGDPGVSLTNLVSNTGVVATDTTGVGTARYDPVAAGYGTDKAIFGYGYTGANVSIINLVSNTGVVANDTTGIGSARRFLAAAGYGTDKAIFSYGYTSGVSSLTNLVSNTGVVANDTTGIGTARRALAAAGYGTDKAIFGYGATGVGGPVSSLTNLVSNTGVVVNDVTGVGSARQFLAAAGYGTDKAIFGYGYTSTGVSMTNLVSNTGVVATDTTGVGTSRSDLAAAGYSTS